MRSRATRIRFALATLVLLAGGLASRSATKVIFDRYSKANFADDKLVSFVRPGLVFSVTSAQIAQDGTITARVKVTDNQGLPLDRTGANTPGVIAMSFVAATIPRGQTQYTSYTTRIQTSTINGRSATQAGSDAGGTLTRNADGDYTYVFATRAPTGFDNTATHTIGVYGSRDLTPFELGFNYASTTFNFVPNGSAVTTTRDVIQTASCARCHDVLAFHGGSRVGVQTCVLCHTPQTTDPDTGNTVDFPVMIHKIHYGAGLPSVRAGKPYQIIGFQNAVSDWSKVEFPADPGVNLGLNSQTKLPIVNGGVRRCETCHEQDKGAKQANAYLTNPNRAACGACHDNVNFASGENHVTLAQPDDRGCANCHTSAAGEYDATIKGAHTIATEAKQLPGINFAILGVDNGTAGSKPTVRFTVKDNAGSPIAMSELKVAPGRLALVLAGPNADYGYTSFGSDVTTPGYVSEDATNATCGQDGVCAYTFTHAIPANATGSYAVGIEGRRGARLNAGTLKEIANGEYGGKNVVTHFSVDGTPMQHRRTIVDIAKCNACHVKLSLHGENRNQIEMCVLCHNPSQTDAGNRVNSTIPAEKASPPQGVNFALMIHRIHTGEAQAEFFNRPFSIIGFGGSFNSFDEVVFPAMHSGQENGVTGAANKCAMCHVSGSEDKLPVGQNDVKDPKGILPTSGAATAACMGCHNSREVASHAAANTSQLGETCSVCHGAGREFAPTKVHAEESTSTYK